jgi:hypothetical protein
MLSYLNEPEGGVARRVLGLEADLVHSQPMEVVAMAEEPRAERHAAASMRPIQCPRRAGKKISCQEA